MIRCIVFSVACLIFCHPCLAQNDSIAVKAIHDKLRVFQENDLIDSILFYETKAMQISRKINYEPGVAHALSSFGVIYKIKGEYPKALNSFFKALSIYEKRKDKFRILVQYSGIASVYFFQNDLEKAKSYYLKALSLSRALGDKRIESDNLCNLAGLYNQKGEFANAEECLLKALTIDKAMKNEIGEAHEMVNLGEIYQSTGNYEKSIEISGNALALAKKLKYLDIMPGCYLILGKANLKLKRNKEAESAFLTALSLANELGNLPETMSIETTLSEFYFETGNSEKAFSHYKKQIQYRDSMYNEESTKKTVEAEMNYEFKKKQAVEKAIHEEQVLLLQAENDLQKQWRLFLIIGIALCLLLLFFVKRAYDNKKRIAGFLAEESNRKEVLLQEVHHRINNNLQIISSLLSLQANSAADERLHAYLTQSQNRIQSLSVLHELLYQTDSPLKINMETYLNKVLDFHRDVINTLSASVEVDLRIAEVYFPTKTAVSVALIINELVTNSIKYAFNGLSTGKIMISLIPHSDNAGQWQLMVADTGNGLPLEGQVRKDSLGLRLVTIMAKQLNATFTKSNTPGATFQLFFTVKV